MKRYLSPSILSADFAHLGEDIQHAAAAGTQYLHYDVMDGMFVPSISFGMPVHYEACKDVKKTLELIKSKGVKAGVTIKPKTPNNVLTDVLDMADMILLMTVEPGFGGQAYIPESTGKIKELRQMLNEKGLDTDIEVDGGIKKDNLQMVLDAGANVIVAGSAIFKGDIEQNVKDFLHIMGE